MERSEIREGIFNRRDRPRIALRFIPGCARM
jgi:hypothetical protein